MNLTATLASVHYFQIRFDTIRRYHDLEEVTKDDWLKFIF